MPTNKQTVLRSTLGQSLYEGLSELPGSRRFTPEQLEVVYAMAYAHTVQSQYEQALRLFAFLSLYGPTRKHYLCGLALCLQKLGQFDEAILQYSKISVLFPEALEATLGVAECQIAQNALDEARATLALVAQAAAEAGDAQAEMRSRAEALMALITPGATA